MRVVLALGGNALLQRGEAPEEKTQTGRLAQIAPPLARLANTCELVIVHGNGPQVGLLAAENVADTSISAAYPLGDMVAESQGLIGGWIQQSLGNAGAVDPVVTLVCQTVVDAADAAWKTPSKFIGPGFEPGRAAALAQQFGWTFADDNGRSRRVVASPAPIAVVEQDIVDELLGAGVTVVAGGGGGVPVTRGPSGLSGVDAVVDKDAVAALLAINLNADLLVILTDVQTVMAGFGTPSQRSMRRTTTAELSQLRFASGSMGPKVDAAMRFVRGTGRRAAIGSLDDLAAVAAGSAGTQITS